ncbi:hypothetical protein A2Z33_03185 [Candidatus Gottesmanbacteria bacterium RBG_16_52_11]|uniref:HD domain-containing protein n=1 Tax=Candidatus Gottesmanbacteria bacterium RBG_16_52_11 TaxID=1798374 RepID=A0A1F5YVA5_9BACT|nr:MAG: hypothetical protein A2Z33_03185 [Candidatus Gottesmanbacteria bacterium RBG_16_52_11]
MIPDTDQVRNLWEKYRLPDMKRRHVTLVNSAVMLLSELIYKNTGEGGNDALLSAAALLHDIDKAVPGLPGEAHPDTGVRILNEEGMPEVAELVRRHPLHAILDPAIRPRTRDERLLFLADKMVKHDFISVDKRFALWRAEPLDTKSRAVLRKTYPLVKELEREVFRSAGVTQPKFAKMARLRYT